MWKLVKHSLAMRRVQTASVALCLALSAMMLLALSCVYFGVQAGVEQNAKRSGAQAIVLPAEAAQSLDVSKLLFTGAALPMYFSTDTADKIAGTSGIARTTTQFYTQTLNSDCCSENVGLKIIGVDLATDWTIQPLAARELPATLGGSYAIIGAGIGGNVDGDIKLLSKTFTVFDKLAPSGTDLDNSVLINIDVARRISAESKGLSYLWDKYGQPGQLVSAVLVDYEDGTLRSQVNNKITAMGGVNVIERTAVVENAQQKLGSVFVILLGMGAIMLIVTIVQIVSRFYSCVWDRKSELAMYRAIGASASDLRRMIGAEAAIITVGGYLAGVFAGFGLFNLLLYLLGEYSAFPFVPLSAVQICLILICLAGLFALISAMAILVPLRQIGRLDPSLAMQQGDID